MVTRQPQVERRTAKVRLSETDVLPTVPRNYNQTANTVRISVPHNDLYFCSLLPDRDMQYWQFSVALTKGGSHREGAFDWGQVTRDT